MWLLLLMVFVLIFLYRWYRQSLILENLTDKYVFITGCDTGFGNLLAQQLDKHGMKVLAACLTDHGAQNLKEETSSRLQTILLDVTDSKSVSSAAESVSNIVGNAGLWGLVNNAGYSFCIAPNEWQKKEDFLKALNVNLIGMIDVTLHLLPLVRKAKGRIVNVSSAMGRLATVGGGYCPSKYGVEAFSDTLRCWNRYFQDRNICRGNLNNFDNSQIEMAQGLSISKRVGPGVQWELRDFGIKISLIEPGCFQTNMTLSVDAHVNNLQRLWENLPTGIRDSYGKQYYEQYEKGLKDLLGTASPRTYEVPNCMEHALTAVYPWTRYTPGLDSKLIYIPVSYLPTMFSDYWLCRSSPKPDHVKC